MPITSLKRKVQTLGQGGRKPIDSNTLHKQHISRGETEQSSGVILSATKDLVSRRVRFFAAAQNDKRSAQNDKRVALHVKRSVLKAAVFIPATFSSTCAALLGKYVGVKEGKPRPHIRLYFVLCLLILSLTGCDILPGVTVSITPAPSTSNGIQLNVWNKVAAGVEVRNEDWKDAAGDEDTVTIVRFDTHKIKVSVGYQPGQPMSLSDWEQQAHPLALINGGYFDQLYNATALVISNGKVFGQSYQGFGGMLSVNAQGALSLRSLMEQPYDPNVELLKQATQSSPMLMSGGKRTQFNADASQTRRSVVAMDKQGRLLFIVSPNPIFSLDELADLLASSDLSIETALNLDGGSSTGLYVGGSSPVSIDSLAKLPLVIIVKAR